MLDEDAADERPLSVRRVASPSMSEIRHLAPDTLPRPNGYSHVVSAPVERIVFVSGQVPLDAEGRLVGAGDMAAQARQVFENLARALEAEGTTWANVLKLNYFVRDVGQMPAVRSIRDEYVDANRPPASTLIEVNSLFRDDVLIEVDAVAVR
jgi:enamine deaminase RidA (YjgF/YER057c/UK114 family)